MKTAPSAAASLSFKSLFARLKLLAASGARKKSGLWLATVCANCMKFVYGIFVYFPSRSFRKSGSPKIWKSMLPSSMCLRIQGIHTPSRSPGISAVKFSRLPAYITFGFPVKADVLRDIPNSDFEIPFGITTAFTPRSDLMRLAR